MNKAQPQNRPITKLHNRVAAVMAHTNRYAFKGRSRLADDTGVSKSAISRLLNGQSRPTFRVMSRVAFALERELGRSFDIRELFSETGKYPTTFVCTLVKCSGCLPEGAIDEYGKPNPAYKDLKRGYWTGDLYETEGPFWVPVMEMK